MGRKSWLLPINSGLLGNDLLDTTNLSNSLITKNIELEQKSPGSIKPLGKRPNLRDQSRRAFLLLPPLRATIKPTTTNRQLP